MADDPRQHPDDDTLADLASDTGPYGPVADHVAGCARCRVEVAGLREVAELLREGGEDLDAPPPSVWTAVRAGIDGEPALDHDGSRHLAVASGGPATARPRARVSPWWLVAAVVLGVLLGGLGRGWLDGAAPSGEVLARTALDTLDTGADRGTADVVRIGDHVDLDVAATGLDPGAGYLEVWLINRDGTRMVSVGVLTPGRAHQSFAVSDELLRQGYTVVDISREGYDDHPEHSGDSLVRGTLAL